MGGRASVPRFVRVDSWFNAFGLLRDHFDEARVDRRRKRSMFPSGELSIDKDLTISGPGAGNLLIQRSTAGGTPDFRIFNVVWGDVTISGLTVSNGRDDVGGGIYTQGDLTLNDCTVSGNFASESGGGIFNTFVVYSLRR
jgi:hypothetical protein